MPGAGRVKCQELREQPLQAELEKSPGERLDTHRFQSQLCPSLGGLRGITQFLRALVFLSRKGRDISILLALWSKGDTIGEDVAGGQRLSPSMVVRAWGRPLTSLRLWGFA